MRLGAFSGGRQGLDAKALVNHLLDAGRSLEKARIELEGVRYPRWTRVAERSRLNADP